MLLTRTWAVKLISQRLSNLVCQCMQFFVQIDIAVLSELPNHMFYAREYTTLYTQAHHLLC